MDLAGKRVVVVGLGRERRRGGEALCSRAARSVIGADAKPRGALSPAALALERGSSSSLGGHERRDVRRGRSRRRLARRPELRGARRGRARGRPVIGELELAFALRSHARPIVAVGGHQRQEHRRRRSSARCSRRPARRSSSAATSASRSRRTSTKRSTSSCSRSRASRWSASPTFRPRVAVLLNVTDDHLDRYASFEAYARRQGQLLRATRPGRLAVVPHGDALCLAQARAARPRRHVRPRRRRRVDGDRSSTRDGDRSRATRAPGRAQRAQRGGRGRWPSQPFGARDRGHRAACSRPSRGSPHRMVLVAEVAAFATTTTRRAPTSARR